MDLTHGRVDQVSADLAGWASSLFEDASLSLALPERKANGKGVSLYLIELADRPPSRGVNRPPLQLELRYLVTTWAEDPKEAHRLLGEMVFAAMERDEFKVDFKPLAAAAWAALGASPQPSFILCVPLYRLRPEKRAPLVRKPLVVEVAPVTTIYGQVVGVLGSDRAPLAQASVELPGLQLHTNTNSEGRFSFATVPGQPVQTRLLVKARGRETSVTVDRPTSSSNPFAVEIDLSD